MKLRILINAIVAATCLLAFAGSAGAVTIGSSLSHQPNNATCLIFMGDPTATQTCTIAQSAMPADISMPDGVVSPMDGVVVRWRVLAGNSTPGALKLAPRVFDVSTPQNTGELVQVGVSTAPQEFPTRLPIKTGQTLGLSAVTTGSMVAAQIIYTGPSGEGGWLFWDQPVADGALTAPLAANNDVELLMNADVEPDLDHDGFGDLTQDACPTIATVDGLCPKIVPVQVITEPTLSSDFKSLFFSAAVAGALPIKLERQANGRKSGGKCKTKAKTGKRCKLFVAVKTSTVTVAAGLNKLSFKSLRGKRPLAAGTYKLSFGTPVIKTLAFKVKKKR